ncbi:MAG: heme/copper-type cytochrome/quinol oxidase subunit 2 [Psychroserpens sp.]|jgi:heme/copper-type cytochrome/quinol oxidase subunit 2
MITVIPYILTFFMLIIFIWNIYLFYQHKGQNANPEREYFELNAKLNFVTAAGTLAVFVISFLGFNVKDEIIKKSELIIKEMIIKKSAELDTLITYADSLIKNKNILKAGIYIVTDNEFKAGKVYKFEDLESIDKKRLPVFEYAPKLIISTNTGENLRIDTITNEFFILAKPIIKNGFIMLERNNPIYPKSVKFDVWIADYKTD